MSKRQYESKIALAAKNFVQIKDQPNEEATRKEPEKVEIPSEKKNDEVKVQKTSKRKEDAPKKEDAKKATENKPAKSEEDLVAEKVNDIIQSLIDSGQIKAKTSGKVGRPKKYETETVVASVRLTKPNYDYAYNMGRSDFKSMTEYINHLIEEDMNNKSRKDQ